jgi:glutamine cyclotransferase
MKYKVIAFIALVASVISACGPKTETTTLSISPNPGTAYKLGDVVHVKASLPSDLKADSIQYLVDSVRVASRKDTLVAQFKTDSMKLGSKLLTARVFSGGKTQEVSTNIMLLAAHAPELYTYQVEKVFPHDTSSYTEGLLYQDGALYESGGGQSDPPPGEQVLGQSSLRKADLTTGKVLQKVMNDPKIFAEGISIVGDKIIQLTWKDPKIGYVYDKNTFKLLRTFNNNVGVEGWGMCFDGHNLYMDDSTNRIWLLNKDTYAATGYIDVYDDKKAIESINELEYIDGKLYANIYQTNTIIVIDPKTGAVLQAVDLTNLYPQATRNPNADVLNGIAWDAKGKRLFITGKKWPHLYQVKFVKKTGV